MVDIISVPTADQVDMDTCNTCEFETVQDWLDSTQSSGKINGGGFTSNGDGTVSVGEGEGIIRASSTNDYKPAMFFHWDANNNISLTDNSTNYIYVDYDGGSPTIRAGTSISAVNGRTAILLGKIFREGNTLHMIEAGMVITELAKRTLTYMTQVFGEVVRASGAVIAEVPNLYLSSTEGVLFAGLTRLSTPSQDTSGADTAEYYYYNGTAWVENSASQIDNDQYNDITSGLVSLNPNRYGVHWIYIDGDSDGKQMWVYGQGNYTLAQAEASQPPGVLPSHIADFGFLAAKVIVKKGDTTFTELASAYDQQFVSSVASDHGELSGLSDDDHSQYILVDGSRAFTGAPTIPYDIKGETKCWDFTILNPNGVYDVDSQLFVGVAKSALTITKLQVSLDSSTNQVAGDLKYADAFIGFANPTIINDFDTTSGVRVDTSITSGSVASGKVIYLQFDSQPHEDIAQMTVHIEWDYD